MIDNDTELTNVSPGAAAALQEPHREFFLLTLITLGFVAPIVFWRSRRALRRMRVSAAASPQD